MSEEQGVVRVRRPRRRAEAVQQLMEEYQASGLKQREFCRRRGLALSTLQRHLKKQRDGKDAKRSELSRGLVAVEVAGPRRHEAEKALTVVLPLGRKIEVGVGFDASTLAQLVAVLERM